MSYNIFHSYGLDKIHDSLTEDYDYKDTDAAQWKLVRTKSVMDSDGFMTDYAWYTNGDKHIFMFGDMDIYEPDEDYADWETDNEKEASDWFATYEGFAEDDNDAWLEFDEEMSSEGNADFMNEGFNRVYGVCCDLED